MQHDDHVRAWNEYHCREVTILSDWSRMVISSSAILQTDPDKLRDAIHRRHAARWARKGVTR